MLWIALQPLAEPHPCAGAAQTLAAPPDRSLLAPADAATLQALGWHALAFTPRVALLDEAVLLEVSATVRLFGGLARLLKQLVYSFWGQAPAEVHEQQQQQQQRPRAAPHPVFSTLFKCAKGATAFEALGRLRTGLPWRASSRLPAARLPMACLTAARPHHGVLERIGCRTWGDLRQLPRPGLARRFGPGLLAALDQAFGEQPESHVWLHLPEVFDERLELPALVENASALMFAANRLLGRLRAWLVAHGRGLLGVQLGWQLDPRRDVPSTGELVVRMSEPSQDMTHVARLLTEHLARVRLPAPAHTLTLRSLETAPLVSLNHSLLPDERQRGDSLAQLVERLSARLGAQQVRRWQPEARHVPERMQCWVPAQEAMTKSRPSTAKPSIAKSKNKAVSTPLADNLCQPNPLLPAWLLPMPLPLQMHGDRPWHDGPLTLLVGPQRLETTGWAGAGPGDSPEAESPVMRDYFIARSTQAGLLWIFRERPARPAQAAGWFLHGIFA